MAFDGTLGADIAGLVASRRDVINQLEKSFAEAKKLAISMSLATEMYYGESPPLPAVFARASLFDGISHEVLPANAAELTRLYNRMVLDGDVAGVMAELSAKSARAEAGSPQPNKVILFNGSHFDPGPYIADYTDPQI